MTAPTNLRSHVDRVATSRAMFMKYSSHDARCLDMAGHSTASRESVTGRTARAAPPLSLVRRPLEAAILQAMRRLRGAVVSLLVVLLTTSAVAAPPTKKEKPQAPRPEPVDVET